jgi:hypothetical protein
VTEERTSYVKEIIIAVVIALVAGGTAPWWWTALFGDSGPPTEGPSISTSGQQVPCRDASISLSSGEGPSGSHVIVRGTGFPSDEAVEVRFHTEQLPPARTDAEGSFKDDVIIPGTLDAFAPQQFEITATTKPTICSDSNPFLLTTS